MKKLTLFPIIALAIGILVSCNSAPDMEAMKVKQAAMVDSLVSVGISTKREEFKMECEKTVQMAIMAKLAQLDSMSLAAKGKGTGKTTQKPAPKPAPKPGNKPAPAPAPAPKPAPKPAPTQTEIQKGRGGAIEVGKNVEQQKERGGVVDPTKREDNIIQQKKRGGAVAVPPQ